MKREHTFKRLKFFNPKLQLKDTESVIKSKLIELLTQLKIFEFVTKLMLKNIKSIIPQLEAVI